MSTEQIEHTKQPGLDTLIKITDIINDIDMTVLI